MSDFLLELRCEEIPARMQAGARDDLARLCTDGLASAGLSHGAIRTYSTPRRLVLIAGDLPEATEAVSEEIKGPRAAAPPQALEGFLRKTGLSQDQLEDRDGVWFARIDRPGRATGQLLAELIPQIIRGFPWPKSMRWGDASANSASLRWVRPLHGIVAMLGETIVPVSVDGIESGAATVGHRFHHPGLITIGGADDYFEKLRACHVIVDHEERERIIRDGAAQAATDAGLALVEDEGLVVENAGLTEWPVPLFGKFDASYLDVPREVIVLTMRTNQKYFACTDGAGGLAPAFVCVANIAANDGGEAIVEGNRRVLAARLSDARFFWEQDLKVPLQEQAKKLDRMVFHQQLGTMSDHTYRIKKVSQWLVASQIVHGVEEHKVERAAELAKADLVTGVVGEFPEVQGILGSYVAQTWGESKVVVEAIRDHYKPIGRGDRTPTEPVTVTVSLAEKLVTIASFFAINERPTGSKDPFALRRSALGALSLIIDNQLRVRLSEVLDKTVRSLGSVFNDDVLVEGTVDLVAKSEHDHGPLALWNAFVEQFPDVIPAEESPPFSAHAEFTQITTASVRETTNALFDFFADRLKVQQREAGVRHDLIDAVFALGGEDDLVRLLARVKALQAFVETGEGRDLLAGYKRAANILKKEEGSWTPDQVRGDDIAAEEQALISALDAAEPKATTAIEVEDFTAAMAALASLRGPIDAFFDKVTVNDPDPGKRARRLALLARFRDAVNRVADFSRIEG